MIELLIIRPQYTTTATVIPCNKRLNLISAWGGR